MRIARFIEIAGFVEVARSIEVAAFVEGDFLARWFCLRIGGLGWSVAVVVLVLAEQLEGLGGLGEDANGLGAAYLDGVGVAVVGEDVGDSVDRGFELDRVSGGGAGDDEFEAMF